MLKEKDLLTVFVAGSATVISLVVFIILFFLLYERKRQRYLNEVHLLEISKQKDMMEAIIATQENERKYFAEELHDSLGQMLSAIRIKASTTRELIMKGNNEADAITDSLNEIRDLSTESIKEVRIISQKLLPVVLQDFGLKEAVSELCIRTEVSSGIIIDFECDREEVSLGRDRELAVYRILQELINNMIKHAEATKVKISFEETEAKWCLNYDDNGKGFDPATTRSSGLGLKNLESRTQVLNGTIDLKSAPGKGMQVRICIPQTQNI